ncbi:F0F1 ATP synthase subunit delta [Collinsella sp. zg1085]|nr:F0F1 ATP synthase subunit delta [Collinsella sp. zg1085]
MSGEDQFVSDRKLPKSLQPKSRVEQRRLEIYARTLLEAAQNEDRVYQDLAPLRAEADASPEVMQVLSSMAVGGDLDKLPAVLSMYREMVARDRDVVGVHVTTAIPLDDELRDFIKRKCEADLESRVFLIEHVDATIIGGVILSVNGHRRDASIRMQLESVRKVLTQTNSNSEV